MINQTETRRGNLSFFLGGKSPSDPVKWTPDLEAVKSTIRYVKATGRLDPKYREQTFGDSITTDNES